MRSLFDDPRALENYSRSDPKTMLHSTNAQSAPRLPQVILFLIKIEKIEPGII
jgi:hypothetical protein